MKPKLGLLLAFAMPALPALAVTSVEQELVETLARPERDGPGARRPDRPGRPDRRAPDRRRSQRPTLPAACREIKPTDAQKAAIRDALVQHRRDGIALAAALKTAHLDLATTLANPSSTREQANAAATKVSEALGDVAEARSSLKLDILYNVLTTEQREPALKCLHAMKPGHRRGQGRSERRDHRGGERREHHRRP